MFKVRTFTVSDDVYVYDMFMYNIFSLFDVSAGANGARNCRLFHGGRTARAMTRLALPASARLECVARAPARLKCVAQANDETVT